MYIIIIIYIINIRQYINMVLSLLSRQQKQKKMVSAQTVATIELNRFLNTHMQFSTGVSRKFVLYNLKSNFEGFVIPPNLGTCSNIAIYFLYDHGTHNNFPGKLVLARCRILFLNLKSTNCR